MRNYHVIRAIVLFLGIAVLNSTGAGLLAQERKHPLDPVIRVVTKSLRKIEQIPAYEATFTKKELVGNQMIAQKMRMKFRRKPFSVYFYFYGDNEGREVIYVKGRNNGKILAHETGLAGLVGTLNLDPSDSMAMSENRHPITEAGIEAMVANTLADLKEATKYDESVVKFYKDAELGQMMCNVIEVSHPQPRRQFPLQMLRLWIDKKSGITVRLQQFGFPAQKGGKPPVVEDYVFTDLKTAVKLTDGDFDINNPKYNY